MGRLIVVSNRLPLGDNPSGGLVVALRDALSDGGVWVGNSGQSVEEPSTELAAHPGAPFERLSFDLTPDEHRDHYLGYANSVLWPLCHGRVDLLQMSPDYPAAYRRVNARVAQMVAAILQPGDRVWVHDYHHFPLAHELRRLGVEAPIGFFLHIPFPSPMAFQALPDAEEATRWIVAYDLFGLQGQRDVAALFEAVPNRPGDRDPAGGGRLLRRRDGITSPPSRSASTWTTSPPRPRVPGRGRKAQRRSSAWTGWTIPRGLPQRFRAFRRATQPPARHGGQGRALADRPAHARGRAGLQGHSDGARAAHRRHQRRARRSRLDADPLHPPPGPAGPARPGSSVTPASGW